MAFLAIGEIAMAVGENFAPHLPVLVEMVSKGLTRATEQKSGAGALLGGHSGGLAIPMAFGAGAAISADSGDKKKRKAADTVTDTVRFSFLLRLIAGWIAV